MAPLKMCAAGCECLATYETGVEYACEDERYCSVEVHDEAVDSRSLALQSFASPAAAPRRSRVFQRSSKS